MWSRPFSPVLGLAFCLLGSAAAFCTRAQMEFTVMDYTWSASSGQAVFDKHATDVFYDATNRRVAKKFIDVQSSGTSKVWLISDYANKTQCRVETIDTKTTCTCRPLTEPFICMSVPDQGWNYTLIGSLLGLVIGGPYVFEYNYLVQTAEGVVENTFTAWTGSMTPVFQQTYTSGSGWPMTRTTFYQNLVADHVDPSAFVPPFVCHQSSWPSV